VSEPEGRGAAALTLGIDVGTTSVKAILLDRDGHVVAVADHEHGIVGRPGVVEADPRQWWESACAAVRRLTVETGRLTDDVAAVGVTGNMSSVVLLDEHHAALGNAPLLADNRGDRQLAALAPDVRELIFARTGNRPASAFSLSTLLYLRDEDPGRLDKTRTWISAKDYVRLCLTGSVGTDLTDAYNSLLIRTGGGDWDQELLAAVGLPERIFPVIYPSDQAAGTISEQAAARTGIPAGVPVVTGAGDVAAGAFGAGVTDPGDVLISLGTSVTVLTPVDESSGRAWRGSLTSHPSAYGRPGLALASLLTGGLALNWLRELLGPASIPAGLGEPLAAADPLVFLPHLAGAGSPRFDPYTRGSVVGLRPSSRGADLVQAMFESIGFEIAEALTLTGAGPDGEVLVSGGGTRLPAWVQTIADATGRPVTACVNPDVSAAGAARLAWACLGDLPPPPAAAGPRYDPLPQRARVLRQRADNYFRTRDFLTPYYQS
jgi:xylulokinase